MELIFYYLALMSIIAFVLFGADKYKAVKMKWRIPEKNLLASAFLGGGAGAFLGMLIFRHKIRHRKFLYLVPLSVVLWAVIVYLVLR